MQISGHDPVAVAAWQALATQDKERHELGAAITDALKKNERVLAAGLFGSGGREGGDDLSDLDLFVVVADDYFNQAAATAGARQEFVMQAGGHPLVLAEGPQNAPPGGAYLGVLYAGSVGPLRVDWYWQPRSVATLPRQGMRVLFDRVGLPTSNSPFTWDYQPIPEETPQESVARDCGAFWSMLLITAKYVARSPREDGMGLLKYAFVPLNGLEQFVGVEVTPEEGIASGDENGPTRFTDPVLKIALLHRLADRMRFLTPLLAARGVAVPDADTVPQAHRYLEMIEAAALSR